LLRHEVAGHVQHHAPPREAGLVVDLEAGDDPRALVDRGAAEARRGQQLAERLDAVEDAGGPAAGDADAGRGGGGEGCRPAGRGGARSRHSWVDTTARAEADGGPETAGYAQPCDLPRIPPSMLPAPRWATPTWSPGSWRRPPGGWRRGASISGRCRGTGPGSW